MSNAYMRRRVVDVLALAQRIINQAQWVRRIPTIREHCLVTAVNQAVSNLGVSEAVADRAFDLLYAAINVGADPDAAYDYSQMPTRAACIHFNDRHARGKQDVTDALDRAMLAA